LLPNTEHRLTIARELLEAKVKGQLAVLDSFGFAARFSPDAISGETLRTIRFVTYDRYPGNSK
jgi:hypothetical protein